MANKERKVKKVQARHILVGSKELADEIKKKIDDGEEFSNFIERFGVDVFEEEFVKLKAEVGPLDRDNIQTYMDWGKTVVYKLERGEGECAV